MGTHQHGGKRAVFLDRDGVINRNVWNPATSQYESPLTVDKFELLPGVLHALLELQSASFLLFVVSNQPNYAKGKSSPEAASMIHRKLLSDTSSAGIRFADCYYCFHHPDGSNPNYSGPCICRKPSPYFLHQARQSFDVDLTESWMIGDRESDIQCGRKAGTRTVFIDDAPARRCRADADYFARHLAEAASLILERSNSARKLRTRGT
jgi:D-glycero-D-manno-heptose 1,7-bisphosphate phosphatase